MAVEVEAAGQVDEFLRILKQRIWWIVLPFVIVGSLGIFFAVVVPKKYVCFTKVMVHSLVDVSTGSGNSIATSEGQVARYNIRSHARVDSVLNKIQWADYKPLNESERREYLVELMEDLTVTIPEMPRNSGRQMVEIYYKDTDPKNAFEFLTTLLDSWTTEVLNRHLERKQKELVETNDKLAFNRKRLQQINETRAAIRTDHGITPPRQGPDGRMIQVEHPAFTKLRDNDNEISDIESELVELREQYAVAENRWARMPQYAEDDGSVGQGPLQRELEKIDGQIQNLEFQITQYNWAPGHSRRMATDKAIDALKDKRRMLIENAERTAFGDPDDPPVNPDWIALKEELDERDALIQSRVRRLDFLLEERRNKRAEADRIQNAMRDLANLDDDARGLTVSVEELTLKRDSLDIDVKALDSPTGNPFEVHDKPVLPTKPTSPNPWVIAIGSLIFGLGLGLGLAVLKEYSKSCFRSAREINRVMTHPVLGTVNTIRTRRERARILLTRGILGGGSLLFALCVGYVTWAYAVDPDEHLTASLKDAIDGFQDLLR